MSGTTIVLIILIIIAIIGFFLYLRHRERKKSLKEQYGHVPSHTELYFEEYFDDIVDNWDLVKEKDAKKWADGMDEKLDELSGRIDELKTRRKDIDQGLQIVEDRIDEFETIEKRR